MIERLGPPFVRVTGRHFLRNYILAFIIKFFKIRILFIGKKIPCHADGRKHLEKFINNKNYEK